MKNKQESMQEAEKEDSNQEVHDLKLEERE